MPFMNEYDIESARSRYTRATMPNRLALVMVIDNLREWTNSHSDGWAYWGKPRQACSTAMEHVDWRAAHADADISDAEMLAAVRPIKAFLTRQAKVTDYRGRKMVTAEERELILRAVSS